MTEDLKCVNCKEYLFQQPMQCPCGDRLCGPCFSSFKERHSQISCPLCESEISLDDCFRDRAASMELRKAELRCTNRGCSWEGRSEQYKDHAVACEFAIVTCVYQSYGCNVHLPRSQMKEHVSKCEYMPVKCEWCGDFMKESKAVHWNNTCTLVPCLCDNGCGELIPRKDLETHKRTLCIHQVRHCEYKEDGCSFMGYRKDLNMHYLEQSGYHMQLLKQSFKKREQSLDRKIMTLAQQNSDLKSELNQVRMEISIKMQPVIDAVVKAESAIQHLQEGFSEMALMVQTLQATSYSGVFIWKIPEIQRRRHEAKTGKTVSLYSAPFYTSNHGYKMCLRLYMNGDGTGKGTHLSFFFVLMKGDNDNFLQWPFEKKVTVILLNQNYGPDIAQAFVPTYTSSSFLKPQNDMNIASGCPMFAPLSVLDNLSYVKSDAMLIKCVIETKAFISYL